MLLKIAGSCWLLTAKEVLQSPSYSLDIVLNLRNREHRPLKTAAWPNSKRHQPPQLHAWQST